eukprot:TRINITY_DN35713_c0_g1_i1.p1 TRINITY_DN35713_c0_g1~~TRINITY_DN35713_c0_g1_i1.p1  ORF type:complete len:546 (+),score=131.52 TRINITY_DN35713_c0_g1_i1:106-1743(+)
MTTMASTFEQVATETLEAPILLGRVSEPLSKLGEGDEKRKVADASEAEAEEPLPLTRQMSTMSAMMAVPAFEKCGNFATSLVFPVMIFDSPLDIDLFRERLRQRIFLFQRFRSKAIRDPTAKRIVDTFSFEPLPLSAIDMDYHVTTNSSIKTEAQMFDHLNHLWATGMDLERPLWRWVYLDNCEDGRHRLLGVFDHSIGDGFTMVKTLLSLLDDMPDTNAKEAEQATRMNPPPKRSAPSVHFATKLSARLWGMVAPFMKERLADTASCLRPKGVQFSTTSRVFAHTEPIELAQVKEVKARFEGATVNDVMMALLSMTLKRYLDMHGGSDGVRMSATFPINNRQDGAHAKLTEETFGNKILIGSWPFDFSFSDRIECVWRAKRTAAWVKNNPQPHVESLLQSIIMPRLSLPAIHDLTKKMSRVMPTAVLTNVPGPQEPVSLLGQEVAEMRFHAVSNTFGVMYQVFSYNGQVTATINVDPTVGNPAELAAIWKDEFTNLYSQVIKHGEGQMTEPPMKTSYGTKSVVLSALAAAFLALSVGKMLQLLS